ncbi:E2/UBC family protein [Aeromonas salmonicida]|uniref:E2/UBC family protein n=3 Tax=Aeromonas salmonicida TaxID=645 RepID=UPI001D0DA826|nr:ThiF family adenylyltransferase [Aeromonas salmonicida subsp. salmonicida]
MKDYTTDVGIFSIALVLSNDPHIKLPTAFAIQRPDYCLGRLTPHISHEGIVCYVSQMEADWDPNNLNGLYRDVDAQIQITLNNTIKSLINSPSNDTELEGEFSAYWRPIEDLFILSKPIKKSALSTWVINNGNNTYDEYLTVENALDKNNNEHINWLRQRGLKPEGLKKGPIPTHYILVKPTKLAGVIWPPMSFSNVLTWLSEVDHIARDRVIDCLLSKNKKRHVILLDIEHQDTLAIYIELNLDAINIKRHTRKNPKSSSLKYKTSLLSGRSVISVFKRLSVTKSDRDTLLSRNLPRPGIGHLSSKRIALIGCGTIGGYLAQLLLRSGAGCGEKHFHLYDSDHFSPHNFGRHTLTANHFGKNKALALADTLYDTIHIVKNIKGFSSQFPILPKTLAHYDIIIDATGRPPVSKRLSAVIRMINNEPRPILIHALNDGNGRASKVLVDDGSCCYGCMVSDPATHRNNIDLRFEKIDQSSEIDISCGSTYTPYDAAVSHITAALAQEATLNTLEENIPWTYNEHMFDGSRSRKQKRLVRYNNCPICHE